MALVGGLGSSAQKTLSFLLANPSRHEKDLGTQSSQAGTRMLYVWFVMASKCQHNSMCQTMEDVLEGIGA